jgi:hypothetical protein
MPGRPVATEIFSSALAQTMKNHVGMARPTCYCNGISNVDDAFWARHPRPGLAIADIITSQTENNTPCSSIAQNKDGVPLYSFKKPPRNIVRVDNDANGDHGWVVTLQRKGAMIVKRFSDGVYGGKREALDAAVEYRDSFLALENPFDHQIWIRTRRRKNNKSGIPGVLRYEVAENANTGRVRAFWLASWTDEHGATRTRKFSVTRYGEQEARRLAVAERGRQLNRVCAINTEDRVFQRPDHDEIWEASQKQADRRPRRKTKTRTEKAELPSKPRQNIRYERGAEEEVQIVEATIDEIGSVRLLQRVRLNSVRSALVTIFPEGRTHPRAKR